MKMMKDHHGLVITVLLLATVFMGWSVPESEAYGVFEQMCSGLEGECYGEEKMEGGISLMMGYGGKSGRSSRNLRTVNYISYDALKKDRVPCGRRGNSYYDCNKREKANPYRRGCSVITHCARQTD